jgi:murein DD-endopeptidase MepM/ murein hydrolase activator NlpD
MLTCSLAATGVSGETIKELQNQSSGLKESITNARSKLTQATLNRDNAKSEIEQLDNELASVQAELNALIQDLEETTQRLDLSRDELDKAVAQREQQYEALKKRIRVMYENGATGYLEVILNAEDIADFLKRIEYTNRLMEYDNKVLEDFQTVETLISDSVTQIESDKANLERLQKESEDEQELLNEKIAKKNELVKQLDSDVETYQEQITNLEQEDADIQAMIKKKQADAAAASAAKSSNSSSSGSSSKSSGGNGGTSYTASNKVYESNGSNFMYPVPAYSGCTPNSGYGYRGSPISGGTEFHTGLDLKATLNTDVVAAESGTVIYAGWRGGYGNAVIIDHGGGISTLYAHNNSLCVSVGDTVTKGQVISKAGTTGYSTGVHLHFEVRINGAHTNPTPYIY